MGLYEGMELPSGETVIEVRRGGFAEVGVLEDGFGGKRVVKRIRDEFLGTADEGVTKAFFQECQIWAHHLTKSPPEPDPHIARALYTMRELVGLGPAVYVSYVDGPSLGRSSGPASSR